MSSIPPCNLRLILSRSSLLVFLGIFAAVSHAGPITMTVFPSIAPNVYAPSSGWAVYNQRAMSSLENNSGNIGTPATDPSAYRIIGSFYPGQIIVSSGFPSWNGLAYPSAPFNNEYGSRIHWGLHIVGGGVGTPSFRLANLWNDMNSNDPWNSFNLFVEGFFGSSTFGSYMKGISYGADRTKGGGDDTTYNSGQDSSQSIDELIYVGVGNAYWSIHPPDPQADLNSIIAFMGSVPNFTVSNRYCLYTDNHEADPIIMQGLPCAYGPRTRHWPAAGRRPSRPADRTPPPPPVLG